MEKAIVYTIIALITVPLLMYLNKKTNTNVLPTTDGNFELRLHKIYWYLGVIFIVLGAFATIASISSIEGSEKWLIGSIFLVIFIGIGTICALVYSNHFVKFNSKKLEIRSGIGKTKTFMWTEIETIKFNPLTSFIIFRNSLGDKVKVHQHVVGLKSLFDMMEEQTDLKQKDLKIPYQ